MELFLGAMLLVGCIGFVLGVLLGTCGTLVLMAPTRVIKEVGPELEHPVAQPVNREEVDISRKEADDPVKVESLKVDSPATVERPRGLPENVERPQGSQETLETAKDSKEMAARPEEPQIFILKGYLATQDGWGSHSGKCKRFRKIGTYDQRRPCVECCSAQGRELSALNFDVVYICHQPSEVYHGTRGCGKLRCARHITTIQMCQCSDCRSQALGLGS